MTDKPSVVRRVLMRPIVVALAWTLVPAVGAILTAQYVDDADLDRVLYVGAGTLIFGGFFGAMIKVYTDEIVAGKRRREEVTQFVANVLADLKSVYDRVARARILIPAHKSVKTYNEEMQAMIEARVQLRNVTRALERRAEGVDEDARQVVITHVKAMEKYLETLSSEFRECYKPLSDKQRGYEERTKVILKAFAESDAADSPPALPDFVWQSIAALPRLSDFIGEAQHYTPEFEKPLDDASEALRTEMARLLRTSSAAWQLR